MKARDTIFDSQAENGLFRELDSRLNPNLRLMAQTPLRSLIELDEKTRSKLKPSHWRYFLSAVVDFTYVYPNGRPLLSIEFDGVGGGFSRGRQYVPRRSTPDTNRAWKMNFKLRAAARVGYPLFVIAGDELEHLDEDESLMVADGIVGQIYSRWEEKRLVEEFLARDEELMEGMSELDAYEHAQDLVLQAGVEADLEYDPLAIAVANARQDCERRFGFGHGGFTLPWLYSPALPSGDGSDLFDLQALHSRMDARARADRVGGRVGVRVADDRYITATAWVRNIGQDHGLMPELVAEQLAEYLAVRRAARLAETGELQAAAVPSPL